MRFLTPTENKRLNELIGFLCIMGAVLVGLALISYSPKDAAFNVSASSGEDHLTHNWMGPVGAYASDLGFQIFGFAAFLLPVALGILGYRWFRSQTVNSQAAKLSGYVLLMLSLPSLLSLAHMPDVRGALPPGGVLGALVSHGLQGGFNTPGAVLVAGTLFVVALFMTTSFSFSGEHAWASSNNGPLGRIENLGILRRAQARWQDWREQRHQERMRREVEERRIAGRRPVAPQVVGKPEAEESKSITLEDLSDIFNRKKPVAVAEEEEEEEKGSGHKAPIMVLNPEKADKAKKSILVAQGKLEPKIAKENASYKLPSLSLLVQGEGSQKLDEDELKYRARAIEEKCHEFDVEGRVTQINPGPVVTTFEFKPSQKICAWRCRRSRS